MIPKRSTRNHGVVCPHCGISFNPEYHGHTIPKSPLDKMPVHFGVTWTACNSCQKTIVWFYYVDESKSTANSTIILAQRQIEPIFSTTPFPAEVPTDYQRDFNESKAVLAVSPKASAALSRRCLQKMLREKAGVKKDDLSKEIQQVLDSKALPSHLAEDMDAIRNIGAFAAHPIKGQSTGEIADVEPEEAEWNLEVLVQLFDFYFVQPERSKAKRDELNKKLKEHGKPPMKLPE